MKFEIKKDFIWKPGTSPETMAEVLKEFDKRFTGFEQNAKGLVKRNTAEGFLQLFNVETRQQIEDELARLNALNDPARFRTDALLAFAEMLINGIKVAGNKELVGKLKQWAEEYNAQE